MIQMKKHYRNSKGLVDGFVDVVDYSTETEWVERTEFWEDGHKISSSPSSTISTAAMKSNLWEEYVRTQLILPDKNEDEDEHWKSFLI
jgi:hypothetical protein